MPSAASKNKPSASRSTNRDRRSSSRHSTPVSALTESTTAPPTPLQSTPSAPAASSNAPPQPTIPRETAYLHTVTASLLPPRGEGHHDIEQLIQGTSSRGGPEPPTAKELHGLHDRIRDSVGKSMAKRGEACDRSMRLLVQKRKDRQQREREADADREAQEQVRKRDKNDAGAKRERDQERGDREKVKKEVKLSRKRSHDEMEVDEEGGEDRKEKRESVPSVGAHGVARQDGVGVHDGAQSPPTPPIQPGTGQIDPMDTAASPASSTATSSDPSKDPSATVPLYERAFGKDPTQFDDPTVYDIRDIDDSMTLAQKREILQVKHWPASDLRDLTAGDPPDADFSNAKPANQVNFGTFQTYAEPFIRPYTEEDVAFLKDSIATSQPNASGDRDLAFVIPARGTRGYKEVWAAEDGLTGVEPPARQEKGRNEPRGGMEEMGDDVGDTDEVSMGPVMNRLLSLVRPQPGAGRKKGGGQQGEGGGAEDEEGDITMTDGVEDPTSSQQAGAGADDLQQQSASSKPVTALPSDLLPRPLPGSTHPPPVQPDYESLEQRALQELKYIGFLSPSESNPSSSSNNNSTSTSTNPTNPANYETREDDEVAARLRTLQHELRRISHLNNLRKSRVLELAEERMAMQEYSNIADDLDNQVNAAYLKRNRSLTKPSSSKKHQAAAARLAGQKGVAVAGGAAGAGGRGVSEGVKALMQKREDWIGMVGPVVGFGRPQIPGNMETVFDEASMRRLEKSAREAAEVDGPGEGE
ncbi:hypothetical protein D0863_15069 [Hortaea werneckii]|uniref:Transcriptional regulator Ngg1 n=1 Tax=Hortaea werneckii TaxID=91943 RepID=A0A3M7CD00_HORWE|nr:hypothetical protein D0863_15069 [Hortaea werneckii]